jgi:hypothetical protein
MAMNEIIELTQILLNLLGKKSELDKKFFIDFIDPVWNCFLKSHENYKLSLQEYSQLLSQKNTPLSKVVKKIKQDLFYTSDLRSELKAIMRATPSPKPPSAKKKLSNFIGAIIGYFYSPLFLIATANKDRNASDELLSDLFRSDLGKKFGKVIYEEPAMIGNYARWALYKFGRNQKANSYTMQYLIDTILDILQRQYEEVADAYYQLRTELLS